MLEINDHSACRSLQDLYIQIIKTPPCNDMCSNHWSQVPLIYLFISTLKLKNTDRHWTCFTKSGWAWHATIYLRWVVLERVQLFGLVDGLELVGTCGLASPIEDFPLMLDSQVPFSSSVEPCIWHFPALNGCWDSLNQSNPCFMAVLSLHDRAW